MVALLDASSSIVGYCLFLQRMMQHFQVHQEKTNLALGTRVALDSSDSNLDNWNRMKFGPFAWAPTSKSCQLQTSGGSYLPKKTGDPCLASAVSVARRSLKRSIASTSFPSLPSSFLFKLGRFEFKGKFNGEKLSKE